MFECYMTALVSFNQKRRSLAFVGSALRKRAGMCDGGKDGRHEMAGYGLGDEGGERAR